jgi:hypothetical protein
MILIYISIVELAPIFAAKRLLSLKAWKESRGNLD